MRPMLRKLRVTSLPRPFHVVLVEPEIPQNTGNIARLCAATQSHLHLCGRLGFRIDEKSVRRAGVDYWPLVSLHVHEDFGAFLAQYPDARVRLFSANGGRSYLDADLRPGDALVFGKESVGLPASVRDLFPEAVHGIPTSGAVRSLNLASAAAIVVYEALRQSGGLANPWLEGDDGPDFGA